MQSRKLVDSVRVIAVWLVSIAVAACTASTAPKPALDGAQAHALLAHYAALADAVYADATLGARDLSVVLQDFRLRPTAEKLALAQEAWKRARTPYRTSEVFRFYGGPIDAEEMWINTWPIDEGFVERVHGGAPPGLIDDVATYPQLSKAVLHAVNARDGETAISAGYHVLEFLLWGVDNRSDAPGGRSVDDFLPADARAVGNADRMKLRRAEYLESAAELLVDGLTKVHDAWAPSVPNNYRTEFLAMPARAALQRITRGFGALSGPELSGERLSVAYETRDQEHEHSCFSDTTTDDIVGNATALRELCHGRYTTLAGKVLSGPSLCTLARTLDPSLGAALQKSLEDSVHAASSIPAPFDRAIAAPDGSAERLAIARTIASLRKQSQLFARLIAVLAESGSEQ